MSASQKVKWYIPCGILLIVCFILGGIFSINYISPLSKYSGGKVDRDDEKGRITRDGRSISHAGGNSSVRDAVDAVDATERLEKLEASLERQQKLNGWTERGVDYSEAMGRNIQQLYAQAGVGVAELENLPEGEIKNWLASNQKLKSGLITWLEKLEEISLAWDEIQNYPGNNSGVISPIFSRPVDLSDSSFSPAHYLGGRVKFASAEEYENFAGLEWYLGGMVASGPFPELVSWMIGRKDVVPSKTVDIVVISIIESGLNFEHGVAGSDVSRLASELADAKNPDYRMIGQLAEKRSQAH